MRRPIASASAFAAPPALPSVQNTSNGLSVLVLVDRDVKVPERRHHLHRVPAQGRRRCRLCRAAPAVRSLILQLAPSDARSRCAGCAPPHARRQAGPASSEIFLADSAACALRRSCAGRQNLTLSRAVAIHGHALAAEAERELVDLADVLLRGLLRGKFVVLEIAESVCAWKAACIRTCHSGVMSCAVRKIRWTSSGTSSKWM